MSGEARMMGKKEAGSLPASAYPYVTHLNVLHGPLHW
jgi:hypothetical protein